MSGYIELSNGVRIPSIGFGTWQTPDGKTAEHAVSFALRNGYSHIDAAAIYGNEKGVGAGIRASGVPRERILSRARSGTPKGAMRLPERLSGRPSRISALTTLISTLSTGRQTGSSSATPMRSTLRPGWQ